MRAGRRGDDLERLMGAEHDRGAAAERQRACGQRAGSPRQAIRPGGGGWRGLRADRKLHLYFRANLSEKKATPPRKAVVSASVAGPVSSPSLGSLTSRTSCFESRKSSFNFAPSNLRTSRN